MSTATLNTVTDTLSGLQAASLPVPIIDGLPFSPVVATSLGWIFCAVLLAAASSRLPWPRGCRDNPWLFIGLGILTLLPVGDLPGLAAGLHGMFGAPSITLLQLSVLTLLNREWPTLPKRGAFLPLLVAALTFYGLALGAGKMVVPDPYAWGYQPQGLLLCLGLLGGVFYLKRWLGWLLILTIDLACWGLGIHESHNLWDVLFDPLLWLVCTIQAFRPHQPAEHPN